MKRLLMVLLTLLGKVDRYPNDYVNSQTGEVLYTLDDPEYNKTITMKDIIKSVKEAN